MFKLQQDDIVSMDQHMSWLISLSRVILQRTGVLSGYYQPRICTTVRTTHLIPRCGVARLGEGLPP
jgi:hypothetical protein